MPTETTFRVSPKIQLHNTADIEIQLMRAACSHLNKIDSTTSPENVGLLTVEFLDSTVALIQLLHLEQTSEIWIWLFRQSLSLASMGV